LTIVCPGSFVARSCATIGAVVNFAQIENKGLVRHSMKTFKFDVRYAKASDELVPKSPFLVYVPQNEGPTQARDEGAVSKPR
jgi:hypothetical protein